MSKDIPKEHEKPVVQQTSGHLTKVSDTPFQPADKPFPLPEDAPDAPPWEKAEFRRRVLEAGFPGSPGSDTAFLAALYKFAGGKIEEPKKEEHKK